MSTHKTVLTTTCKRCGHMMERVHVKNCHIDDCEDQCSNPRCPDFGQGEDRLLSYARHVANAEERAEHDNNERDDSTGDEE